ncbi:uncharacterized protein LOC142775312 [Rhipicephalus microplus]|uniref:uncharacterized protein LOC142775312 n=1 Tax=Rhipicephalus microplus TaxID=6941 RepID=UPI003F6DA07A
MATLVTDKYNRDRLANIANKLEEIGCEQKVTFVDYYTGDSISLADCKNYSKLFAYIRATDICKRQISSRRALCHLRELCLVPRGRGFEFPCSLSEAHRLTIALDVARRNCGYVARAAQFLHCKRCDTPCAAALDRVHRHPALVAELSKVLSISVADVVVAVNRRLRSIEGMHEFMRLAGVVKTRVTCQPRDDGCTQLNALDEQRWANVRRHLQLDDVVWQCPSSTNVM